MKKIIILIIGLTLWSNAIYAQHTFSIVAVDPNTGEVGGAGATCYETVIDIADVHPGVGMIHSQSLVNADNQAYAHNLMTEGLAPQQIIDSLVLNDAQGNNTLRQYGVVDLIDGGRSATFTGSACYSYHGEITGPTYAIQGNILSFANGEAILNQMEANFNATDGSLADKLMAALQAGNMPGADRRCEETSSLSAFLLVAKPNDTPGNYYLTLNVENDGAIEPIDSLQTLFNEWKVNVGLANSKPTTMAVRLYPNPTNQYLWIDFYRPNDCIKVVNIINLKGEIVWQQNNIAATTQKIDVQNLPNAAYLYQIITEKKEQYNGKFIVY